MAGNFNLANEWTIRAFVLLSLGAHIVLVRFAGIRRREATGWRMLLLWAAYQVASWAATTLTSLLSQSSTSRQQQLVVFWIPFLLMHLGGPDNITAYSLEDNKLSMRKVVNTVLELLGTYYVITKQLYVSGTEGTLLWAFMVMGFLGAFKYGERAWALWRSDFSQIRSSATASDKTISLSIEKGGGGRVNLNNDIALLIAHELLHITKGAFADYSVDGNPLKRGPTSTSKMWFPWSAKDMRKVVEMELSLMYDILYTKAPMIHTWRGYLVRVASPITTATVTMLFWLDNKHGQRRAYVIITRTLLVITFLLEVWWLLSAAASTWTYAFLKARPSCWLYHVLLCSRRWQRLRQFAVSLDPQRLLLREPCGSYRLWSGTIGQYNLLHECTHHDTSSLWSLLVKTVVPTHHDTSSLWSLLVKKVVPTEIWMEYQYSKSLNKFHFSEFEELFFSKIHKALNLVEKEAKKEAEEPKAAMPKPDAAFKRRRLLDEALAFFPEFQELILIWHVATDIVLLDNHEHLSENWKEEVKAIEALSNYMTFLAAVRPHMLPGLKLRSLYDVTRQALERIWQEENDATSTSRITNGATRGEDLASILRMRNKDIPPGNDESVLHDSSLILSDATKYAEVLLERVNASPADWDEIITKFGISMDSECEKRLLFLIPRLRKEDKFGWNSMLHLILESWVRILIFVSTRCGRDSHAKQLARGCELTTIVWILSEHAGLFHI